MATLYFHIPFCKRICSYCDFYRVGAIGLLPSVVEMLHRELDQRANYLTDERLTSIYFGGGTPSLLHPNDIEQLIDHARQLFDCSAVEEITIEANPDDIDTKYAEALARTSVNRVSLGIQSFDDEALRFMNRRHSAEEAREAIGRLRNAGIQNISGDLIFGIARFGGESLEHSLQSLITLGVEHISAYHLTIEPRTALGKLTEQGGYTPIDEATSEIEYRTVHQRLTQAGYEHYEVSNFALNGHRARHNSAYWQGVPYLGIGPGAHSFSGEERRWCVSSAREYGEGKFLYESEQLTDTDHLNEYVMTSLRRIEGIDLNYIEQRFGTHHAERIAKVSTEWLRRGTLIRQGNTLAIPAQEMLLSDAVIEDLFA